MILNSILMENRLRWGQESAELCAADANIKPKSDAMLVLSCYTYDIRLLYRPVVLSW